MQNKSLVKNSIYNILRTLVTLLFPLVIFMYASRILGPDGIGKVEFGKNISGYFVLFASLGINNYGIREGARLRNNRCDFTRFVHEILFINIISTVISFLVFLGIAFFLNALEPYRSILLVFSVTIIMTPMGVEWAYGALEEYRYIAIRTTVFQILALAVLLVFVRNPNDIIWYAVVLIVSSVGSNVMNIIHIWKYVDFRVVGNYNIKRHLLPILILFALAISNTLYSYIDTTMIGFINGDREVGLYTAALKVNRIVVNVLGAIGAVVMPRLSYLWANNRNDEFQRITHMVINTLLMVSIPSCVGIIALAEPLLIVFCGSAYLDAVLAMRILSLIIIILSLSTFFNMHVLVPVNKEMCTLKAIVAGLFTNIAINGFLIPTYGRNGASIGTVIGEAVVLFLGYYYSKRVVHFHGVIREISQYLIATVPVFIICKVCLLLFNNAVVQLSFSMFISFIAYFIILKILKNQNFNAICLMIGKKIRGKIKK